MQKSEILQLFPVPLLRSKYPKDISKELEYVNSLKFERSNSIDMNSIKEHNNSTNNTFLLEDPELKDISEYINEMIECYSKNILQSKNSLIVTQSWANKNKKGERHHKHTHSNSIISGVFYLKSNENLPPIHFHKKNPDHFQFDSESINLLNCDSFSLPTESGELLLFPSTLEHSVPINQIDDTRISISFNTFFKKSVGNINSLNYLPIEKCL